MTGLFAEEKNVSRLYRQRGVGVIKVLVLIQVALIILLALVFTFYEGRKAYWDYRVQAMCERDGGVTVNEKITISSEEYRSLGGIAGGIPLPHKDNVAEGQSYFYQTNEDRIREWNPEVVRGETIVKRRSDGNILGRSVYYLRRGGDFPTGLFHDSSYLCPENDMFLSKQIFEIKEEWK